MVLKDKVAIITGASQGIGRVIALRFAREGARIVIADIDIEKANKVKEEIEKLGKDVLVIKTDITKKTQVEYLTEEVIKKFKHIDILINNAGIHIRSSLLKTTEDIWDKTLDINLKGTFFCSQAVAKIIIEQGKEGKIINMASICGKVAYRHSLHPSYDASKAGVIALTREMAIELAPYKINVNAIGPGVVETSMTEKTRADSAHRAAVLNDVPLGRYAVPEDIAGAAVFLASKDADYVTGITLFVDGGWLAH